MYFGRSVVLALLPALAGAAPRAEAAPLDDPHVGGLGFSGPTTANLAAVYWNPAALGLMKGNNALFSGTATRSRTTVDRASIDPASGTPGGPLDPGSATADDFLQPVRWPAGPGAFAGVSTDFNGDRFTLAAATFTPFLERSRFPQTEDRQEPTRYHRLEADLRHVALAPALSIRLGGDFRVGFATRFLFSVGRMSLDEDLGLAGDGSRCPPDASPGSSPCTAESPDMSVRYHLDSGLSPLDSAFGVSLSGGLFYRRRRLDVGVSYASRPVGTGVDGVLIRAHRSRVEQPVGLRGGALACPPGQPEPTGACVAADIIYRLPDTLIAGVTFRAAPRFEIAGVLRYLNFSGHSSVDIRMTGAGLLAANLPDHLVLRRAFRDVYDVRLLGAYTLHPRVRAGGGLRLESAAVPADVVNAGAVDGLEIEPSAMLEIRATSWLTLGAGYGLTLMPSVSASPSRFDPTAARACAAAGQDLRDAACQARLRGEARPTAEGTYARSSHALTLSVSGAF